MRFVKPEVIRRAIVSGKRSDEARAPVGIDVPVVQLQMYCLDTGLYHEFPNSAVGKLRAGRDPTRRTAVYAGSLKVPGVMELILTCAEELPGWDFIIGAEDNSAADGLRAAAAERRLTNVTGLADVGLAHLPNILAAGDILLAPLPADPETWDATAPMGFLHYAASGRPIVASDNPQVRNLIGNERARFAEPGRAISWVSAIRAMERGDDRRRFEGVEPGLLRRYDVTQRVTAIFDGMI